MKNERDYNPWSKCQAGKKAGRPMGDDEEYRKNYPFEDHSQFMEELSSYPGATPELSQNMFSEMNNALTGDETVLIVGTEGTKTITILIAPEETIGGPGPVLVPTADDARVVSLVSKERTEQLAWDCQDMENQEEAEDSWQGLLNYYFDKTIELYEAAEKKSLEIPDFIPEEGF